jgi:hypothetical protein
MLQHEEFVKASQKISQGSYRGMEDWKYLGKMKNAFSRDGKVLKEE